MEEFARREDAATEKKGSKRPAASPSKRGHVLGRSTDQPAAGAVPAAAEEPAAAAGGAAKPPPKKREKKGHSLLEPPAPQAA
eukprot:CAMPEP_0180377582 /NCGR_PEP_ID=MMETSP0989-20121125/24202_1 /TAXON_ID=697907 /ORGANISM="non described non described, Strain CCMP2293" /LENGTH=81 /DNA_ID=CAMNT_0022376227 /DNA_START=376 /DNA_END=618 /DNA_ORIENTATION=+